MLTSLLAEQLRLMVDTQEWTGTADELAATMMKRADSVAIAAPRLAIWLRQHEPTLWWDYGVSIRFSRTGLRRLVHLSRRDQLSANALSRYDS